MTTKTRLKLSTTPYLILCESCHQSFEQFDGELTCMPCGDLAEVDAYFDQIDAELYDEIKREFHRY